MTFESFVRSMLSLGFRLVRNKDYVAFDLISRANLNSYKNRLRFIELVFQLTPEKMKEFETRIDFDAHMFPRFLVFDNLKKLASEFPGYEAYIIPLRKKKTVYEYKR